MEPDLCSQPTSCVTWASLLPSLIPSPLLCKLELRVQKKVRGQHETTWIHVPSLVLSPALPRAFESPHLLGLTCLPHDADAGQAQQPAGHPAPRSCWLAPPQPSLGLGRSPVPSPALPQKATGEPRLPASLGPHLTHREPKPRVSL